MPTAAVPPPLPSVEPVVAPEPLPAETYVEPPPMPTGAVPAYEQPQVAQPVSGQPTPPAKKKRTGCIIAVVVAILLSCIGVAIAGVLLYVPFREVITEVSTSPGAVTSDPVTPSAQGFATAEEALKSVMAADWVFKATRTTETRVTYWTGPPNSEYVDEIVVEKGMGGSWTVTDQYTIGGGDVSGDAASPAAEEAVAVLSQFLDYIKADKPEDAHKLTVEPFSYDAASAGYSNGEFLSYTIVEKTAQGDGSFWIHVTETWKNSTNDWGYYLVPTDAGYRISDLKPW